MRFALAAVVVAAFGCSDDIGKDSDGAHILAAMCVRVKHPPRERCERVVKASATEVVRSRPTAANLWSHYSIECEEALGAVAKFAPGSNEQAQLKTACCTIPDETLRKSIAALCTN